MSLQPTCDCDCWCHRFRDGRCGIVACCSSSGRLWKDGRFFELGEDSAALEKILDDRIAPIPPANPSTATRWLSSVYKARSHDDPKKVVIRVHGIGSVQELSVEIQLGTFRFDDPDLLALVQGHGEEEARDIARYFAEKLHLETEF